ncbi:L-lysine 2,3-aminomutase [Methylovirgula sp. HY1]|nr:lysine-2,3-aminomutase-like protein [Methylovirgula sp. HY1]QXX75511.1 L-lysine 2,3-aminomutase [Methylovirgula sp. HY1]
MSKMEGARAPLPPERLDDAPLRSAADLVAAGLIAQEQSAVAAEVARQFTIGLSRPLAALIDPDDPDDPIARQFLPDAAELTVLPEERGDPIGDAARSPIEGLVHRYPDRVLLKLIHVCPVYCRFCFRREMVGPGQGGPLSAEALDAAFHYIAQHREIFEVILTGGDPLLVGPRRLADVVARLAAIEHVKILRIHTRVPVAEPALITDALVNILRQARQTVYVALHANHPRELTTQARAACDRLIDAGIPMVSQSVLLRGVNDNVETLAELMRSFVAARIKPYYLHHPDLARGTSHFRLSIAEGRALVQQLRGRLSGLCQPLYVLDIPGGFGKVPVGPSFVTNTGEAFQAEDFNGGFHTYPTAQTS